MKIRIEFDLAEVSRASGDPLYPALYDLFSALTSDISTPGAIDGDITVRDVPVGKWVAE